MTRRLALAAGLAVAASLASAAPANACTGAVCDAINEVCVIVRGGPCVR